MAVALGDGGGIDADNLLTGVGGAKPGRLGKYELIEVLGRGGAGIVFRARDVSLDRFVALKVLRAGELANEEELRRFRSEAEAVAQLVHPNIVPIFEVDEDDGRHFFSMRLVEGGNLARWVERRAGKLLTEGEAARLVACIARAIHFAHQRGFIHRDLKPGNILIDRDGQPHVADLGLVKRMDSARQWTEEGAVLGTPGYMAPEQAAGVADISTAVDVYSLGAILYELIAGRPLHLGRTPYQVLQSMQKEQVRPPGWVRSSGKLHRHAFSPIGLRRGLSDLDVICLKCLEANPADRYDTAAALADDLERWLRIEPIQARPAGAAARVAKWARRKPLVAALALSFAASATFGTIGILSQWRRAVRAERSMQDALYDASVGRSQAERLTRRPGNRARALAAIQVAAGIRSTPELRNEALAALALCDIHPVCERLIRGAAGRQVAFDGELRRVAVLMMSGQVLIGDTKDEESDFRIAGLGKDSSRMRMDRAGSFVGVQGASKLAVWNLATREKCLELQLDSPGVGYGFEFLPSRPWLAVNQGQRGMEVYELPSCRLIGRISVPWAPEQFAFSPDGRRVAVCQRDRCEILDVEGKTAPARVTLARVPTCLCWHPAGDRIAFGYQSGAVDVWDPADWAVRSFDGEPEEVVSLSFNLPGTLLLAGHRNDFGQLWNLETGSRILSLPDGRAVGFSSDGRQIGWQNFERVGKWQLEESESVRTLVGLPKRHRIRSLAFSPHGDGLAGAAGAGVLLWGRLGSSVRPSLGEGPHVLELEFDPDGSAVVGANPDQIWKWPVLAPQPAGGSAAGGSPLRLGAPFLAVTNDPTGRRPVKGRPAGLDRKQDGGLPGMISFTSPAEAHLSFVFGERELHVLDEKQTRFIVSRSMPRLTSLVYAFSHDSQTIAVSGSLTPTVWLLDSRTGAELAQLTVADPGQVVALAFSADDRSLAMSQGAFVQVWALDECRRQLAAMGLDW